MSPLQGAAHEIVQSLCPQRYPDDAVRPNLHSVSSNVPHLGRSLLAFTHKLSLLHYYHCRLPRLQLSITLDKWQHVLLQWANLLHPVKQTTPQYRYYESTESLSDEYHNAQFCIIAVIIIGAFGQPNVHCPAANLVLWQRTILPEHTHWSFLFDGTSGSSDRLERPVKDEVDGANHATVRKTMTGLGVCLYKQARWTTVFI